MAFTASTPTGRKDFMKAVKITNPNWLPAIAPRIAEYCKIIDVPGMTYEQLYTYFAQAIQFSGGATEFWVVFDNDEPVAFAHWMTRGIPFAGKAYFDHLYKWSKSKQPIKLLIEKFTEFYKTMRCTMADANPINDKVTDIFINYGNEHNWEIQRKDYIYLAMNFYPEKEENKEQ